MKELKIGDVVTFTDIEGRRHNALVIHVWESSVNVAYVDPNESNSFGNCIAKETSIPFKEATMAGFYVEA